MPTSAAGSSSNAWRARGKVARGLSNADPLPAGRITPSSSMDFAKSRQSNINDEEEAAFKKAAAHVPELTDEQLAALIRNGQFLEVDHDG